MPAADFEKRRAFALAYATTGNATAAARSTGVANGSAHSMGYKWLHNAEVQAMIRAEQEGLLKGMTGAAISVIGQYLADAQASPQVRLAAAREVLDRAGFAKAKRRDPVATADRRDFREMSRAEIEALVAEDESESVDTALFADQTELH